MSWAEAKWIVDNILKKTGQTPNNMRSFKAQAINNTTIGLTFAEPSDSVDTSGNIVCTIAGVMIRMSDTGYPAGITDGTLVVNNTELGKYEKDAFEITGLTSGKKYYFSAFPYSTEGVYNLSQDSNNRAVCTPAEGETIKVAVSCDDTTGFNSVTVKCVDETDSTYTQTATVSKTNWIVSFAIPTGHVYHVEYGEADGYAKPNTTSSVTAVAGKSVTLTGVYYYYTATINVTYPTNATCTCTLGSTTYTASGSTGSYAFKVHKAGTWVVAISSGSQKKTESVVISSNGDVKSVTLGFVGIYGIKRDITSSSPVWTRTDNAVDFTATASVGTSAGSSSFDNCYPWSGIARETLSTGDVMVKIPKFWYRRYREGNIEYIKIADAATDGFTLHPAFNHGGTESECVYVAAYKAGEDYVSKSGTSTLYTEVSDSLLNGIEAHKGNSTSWSILDISTFSAIQMLILVEFANNNVQSVIGSGYTDEEASSSIATGTCDSVPNLTGRPAGTSYTVDVVWRGIEGLWGNVRDGISGIHAINGVYYYSNNLTEYGYVDELVLENYKTLSYSLSGQLSGFVTKLGFDANYPHIMLPVEATGSESTYFCDDCTIQTNTDHVYDCTVGGSYGSGTDAGLFNTQMYVTETTKVKEITGACRLMYIPS